MGAVTRLPSEIFAKTTDGSNNINTISFNYGHIPTDCLVEIGAHALQGCASLENFGYYEGNAYLLPTSLRTVGDYAFQGCSNTNMKLADSPYVTAHITSVGKYAFDGCEWMDNTIFTDVFDLGSLTYDEGSFRGCKLTSVDLSKSKVINIPDYAFYGNNLGAQGLKLPEGCTSIGQYAFAGCKMLNDLPRGKSRLFCHIRDVRTASGLGMNLQGTCVFRGKGEPMEENTV